MGLLGCSGDLLSGPIKGVMGLGIGANMRTLSGLTKSTDTPSKGSMRSRPLAVTTGVLQEHAHPVLLAV